MMAATRATSVGGRANEQHASPAKRDMPRCGPATCRQGRRSVVQRNSIVQPVTARAHGRTRARTHGRTPAAAAKRDAATAAAKQAAGSRRSERVGEGVGGGQGVGGASIRRVAHRVAGGGENSPQPTTYVQSVTITTIVLYKIIIIIIVYRRHTR